MPTVAVGVKSAVFPHEFGGTSNDDRRVLIVAIVVALLCCGAPLPDRPPSKRVDTHFSHSSGLPMIH
jgi:hypothetical protein